MRGFARFVRVYVTAINSRTVGSVRSIVEMVATLVSLTFSTSPLDLFNG